MDEALASALDKVLILSGGDPIKVAEALNERFSVHTGRSNTSTTVSTVSSPTISLGRFSSPERNVSAPTQLRSPSVGVSSPSREPGKPAQRSRLRTTPATPSRSAPVPPLLFASPSRTARTNPLPSTWIKIQSDSDDEIIVRTRPLAKERDPPPPAHDSAGQTTKPGAEARHLATLPHYLNALPRVLEDIKPEESRLSPSDILLIKGAILTNPFYLGEPRHIFLRNSRGLTDLRVMKVPAPDAPTPEKWYAVACGTQVGIFLSWLVAGVFVQGKNSNMHKSFTVELEAYIWLQAALLRGSVELIN